MNLRDNVRRSVPQLNTSSLPDLIFTVLFFFMVVTHMRTATLKVRYRVPQGTELTRLTKKSAVTYIYMGRPSTQMPEGVPTYDGCAVQLNDKLASPADVADYVSAEKNRMSADDRVRMTVSLKADRNVRMGLVNEVKQALRKANVRKINYSAEPRK